MRLSARPCGPLAGEAVAPGDKSISHRALIFGALARGVTEIEGLLESADVLATARAVGAFGATVERLGEGRWRVAGAPWRTPAAAIDCGNSGTACRLLMGAAAGQGVGATFAGDASLSSRPMRRVTAPLALMGATVEGGERLPLTLRPGRLGGIDYRLPVPSAQVKSAILLAGLGTEEPVAVTEAERTRDHSERMLRAFGAEVIEADTQQGRRIALGAARRLAGRPVAVPGDPSSAAFPVAAALAVPGSDVRLSGVLMNPLRAGLYQTLAEMGADLAVETAEAGGEPVARLVARHGPLSGVTVPAQRAPSMIDEYPVLAALAAFARGT
ncbi:MAG: 3-phosphoshikimate 1-carboxyvinyltransferase, partial [Sphingomonadaceae bacterium]